MRGKREGCVQVTSSSRVSIERSNCWAVDVLVCFALGWIEQPPHLWGFAVFYILHFMLRLAQEQYGPLFVGPACAVAPGGSLSVSPASLRPSPLRPSIITRSLTLARLTQTPLTRDLGPSDSTRSPGLCWLLDARSSSAVKGSPVFLRGFAFFP